MYLNVLQMNTITVLLLLSYVKWSRSEFSSPHCSSGENGFIECSCEERWNITINELDELVEALTIEHCGYVTIEPGAFTGLEMQFIFLNNITELDIQSNAFHNLKSLKSLQILNIGALKLSKAALDFMNVSQIVFQNVFAKTFPAFSVNLGYVPSFYMSNCNFDIVQTNAFQLRGTRKIVFIDTKVAEIKKNGIIMYGATGGLLLENCLFGSIDESAFAFQSMENLTIYNNSIELASSRFLVGVVKNIEFTGNVIIEASPGLFSNLTIVSEMYLTNNRFEKVYNGSLSIPNRPLAEITILNNTFMCGCQIEWIYTTENELFLNSSSCVDISGGVISTRDLKVSRSPNGDCADITSPESGDITSSDSSTAVISSLSSTDIISSESSTAEVQEMEPLPPRKSIDKEISSSKLNLAMRFTSTSYVLVAVLSGTAVLTKMCIV